jgi:hypothetical protein
MGHQICFSSSSRWKWRLTFFLSIFKVASSYSQVEILCRLILRVKKFEDALLFLLSHRWHDFVVVECRENVRSFRCLGRAFSFFMAARFVYFDFFYPTIEVAPIPTLMLFLYRSQGGNP